MKLGEIIKKIYVLSNLLIMLLLLIACNPIKEDTEEPIIEEPLTIVRIVVSNYKDNFRHREDFSSEGLEVEATFSDGTRRLLEENEYEVDFSNYNSEQAGTYEIYIRTTSDKQEVLTESYEVTVIVKEALKILSIGNSFSEDAHQYLFDVAHGLGHHAEVITGNVAIGGSSLQMHYNNASNNSASYAFRKETARGVETFSRYTIKQALESEDWDFVTLQQVSQDSGMPNTIPLAQLEYLTEYIKSNVDNPNVKVYWHATWAYQKDSNHGGFNNYNRNQITMYEAINHTVQSVILESQLFDGIIPNTTAIQNVRTSYIGDTLTRDGFHLSIPHGRYIASLMFYKALSGKDISGFMDLDAPSAILLSASVREIMIEAVENAYLKPFEITNSVYK